MSLNNKIKEQGFTIVELLIVIVVIGILAAITIVAYNGIQNRGKTAAGQSLANAIVKKAEAYNSVGTTTTGYPTTAAAFATYQESTLADVNAVYVSSTAWTTTTVSTTPAAAGSIGAGAADGKRIRLDGTSTGGNVYYWDYQTKAEVAVKYGS